ncbi:MAG: hypothetical protein HOV94_39130 [Saccharothrix sp.]|nr:hypothetical protein [Saccharothrix sp.]
MAALTSDDTGDDETGDHVDYEAMTEPEQDDYDRATTNPRIGWDGEVYDADGNPL